MDGHTYHPELANKDSRGGGRGERQEEGASKSEGERERYVSSKHSAVKPTPHYDHPQKQQSHARPCNSSNHEERKNAVVRTNRSISVGPSKAKEDSAQMQLTVGERTKIGMSKVLNQIVTKPNPVKAHCCEISVMSCHKTKRNLDEQKKLPEKKRR